VRFKSKIQGKLHHLLIITYIYISII